MKRIGFIGTGNMAGAIIRGVLREGTMRPEEIGVYDIDRDRLAAYGAAGHPVYDGIAALVRDCEMVVLSVKPQNFDAVLPEVAAGMRPGTVLVSIAAGISAQRIQSAAGFACKVVLVMPNTPLLVGHGATALARVEPTTGEEFERVRALFSCAGTALEISPDKMCEVIPVNGSSPAFVYAMAGEIAEGAARHGIPPDTAMRLFAQTLIGSAHMLLESGKTASELIDMVSSPGGTTVAAMKALRDGGFSGAIRDAFDACIARAHELSGS